jgi:hypothetical protein
MKKLIFPVLITGLILLVAGACNKKSDSPETISFANMAGTYKVTSIVLSQGSIHVNFYDSLDLCQKDDLFKFNKDSSFQYVDAGTSCSPNGSFSTTWSLKGNVLSVDNGGIGDNQGIIQSLSSKTMVLVSSDTTYSPAVLTTETFARQ